MKIDDNYSTFVRADAIRSSVNKDAAPSDTTFRVNKFEDSAMVRWQCFLT